MAFFKSMVLLLLIQHLLLLPLGVIYGVGCLLCGVYVSVFSSIAIILLRNKEPIFLLHYGLANSCLSMLCVSTLRCRRLVRGL